MVARQRANLRKRQTSTRRDNYSPSSTLQVVPACQFFKDRNGGHPSDFASYPKEQATYLVHYDDDPLCGLANMVNGLQQRQGDVLIKTR